MVCAARPRHAGGMTTTPPPVDGPVEGSHGPRVSADDVRDLGRLRRSRSDRKIAGVAGGLARHLDIDPVVLRVAFVVLVFFGGAGLLLYGAMWLLVPEEGEEQAKVNLDTRTRSAALVIAGVLAALALVGDSWGGYGFPWPVILIGGLVVLAFANRDSRQREQEPAEYAGPDGPGVSTGSTIEGAGPTTYYPPAPRRLTKREKYGPSLFLPTLALIALSLGTLRIAEIAGADVVRGAYPALALAICGAALVLGAWVGRAGTVLWLALFSGLAMGATNVAEHTGSITERPVSAATVHSSYDLGIGRLVLDLTDVADIEELDGQTITLDGNIGQLRVIVPADIDVTANADISGGGRIEMFGLDDDGDNPDLKVEHEGSQVDPDTDAPHLTINADLDFGNIYVTEESR